MEFVTKSLEDSMVRFKGIKFAYPLETSITIQYVYNGGYTPNSSDWIGLFKEGWSTQREYITYMYAQLPTNNVEKSSVDFHKKYLPQVEDGNSYQFCYISSDKNVLGVSVWFRFQNELFEELDELQIDGNNFIKNECNFEYKNVTDELASQNKIGKLEKQVSECQDKYAKLESATIALANKENKDKNKHSKEISNRNIELKMKDEQISKLTTFNDNLCYELQEVQSYLNIIEEKNKKYFNELNKEVRSHKNTTEVLKAQQEATHNLKAMLLEKCQPILTREGRHCIVKFQRV